MNAYVYRHYDSEGLLLYIGSTVDPKRREASRRSSGEAAHWIDRVAHTTCHAYSDLLAARAAEAQAIALERPRYNVKGKPRIVAPGLPTPPAELLTVLDAARELGITPRAVRHRIAAGSLAAVKFGTGETSPYMIDRTEVERAKVGSTEVAS